MLNDRMKKSKLRRLRGHVIDATIRIDMTICAILVIHFIKPSKRNEFLTKFLLDEHCSLGFKLNVIERLKLVDKTTMNDLRRITSIRNLVAHSIQVINAPGIHVLKAVKPYEQSEESALHIDVEECVKEFDIKFNRVQKVLEKLFTDKHGNSDL